MYKEFMELMDKREDWDQEELLKIVYTCLEDMNYHTLNYVFIAGAYGTYEEIEQAAKIMLEHRKAGHALPENMALQREHLGKYVDQLFKEEVNV
mgnify:FL=1